MIEPIHDVMYLRLRQRIQGRAFGHILANQPEGLYIVLENRIPYMVPFRVVHATAYPRRYGAR